MGETAAGAAAIGGAWLAFGLIHSVMSRSWFKEAAVRLMGPRGFSGFYRPLYVLIAAATMLWLWLLPRSLAGDVRLLALPGLLRTLPFLVKGVAAAMGIAAFRRIHVVEFVGLAQLRRWARGVPPSAGLFADQADEPLAREGIYLWARHPLNTATIIWIWAQPVYTVYNAAFAAALTAYILIGNRYEERDLLRRYGEEYERYRSAVPAFFGGLRGLRERRALL